jgi:hypothetical protein
MALLRCARHDYYLSFFIKKNCIGDDAVFFCTELVGFYFYYRYIVLYEKYLIIILIF